MKTINVFTAGVALALATACSPSVKVEDGLFSSPPPQHKLWPDYSQETLSGKVFGQDWKALTAIARPFGQDGKEIALEFYPEVKAKACTSSEMSSKPYATVVIPAAYTQTEYVADMSSPGTGNPIVFSSLGESAKNLVADKTKIRVNSLTDSGLNVSIYAKGLEADGTLTEINGSIAVTDCAKTVDFSVWDEVAGWYTLTSFDGVSVSNVNVSVGYDANRFFDRASGKYVKTLLLPLYKSVGANSESTFNFGPMEGLGTTTVTNSNGVKTFKYIYNGPINFKGMDITLNLEITVVQSGRTFNFKYTLEVPQQVTKTSHQFTMSK